MIIFRSASPDHLLSSIKDQRLWQISGMIIFKSTRDQLLRADLSAYLSGGFNDTSSRFRPQERSGTDTSVLSYNMSGPFRTYGSGNSRTHFLKPASGGRLGIWSGIKIGCLWLMKEIPLPSYSVLRLETDRFQLHMAQVMYHAESWSGHTPIASCEVNAQEGGKLPGDRGHG